MISANLVIKGFMNPSNIDPQFQFPNVPPMPETIESIEIDSDVSLASFFLKKTKAKQHNEVQTPKSILASNSKRGNKYAGLSDCIPESILSRKAKKLYEAIEAEFRKIEFTDTNAAWVQRADLLDAIDKLVELDPSLKPMKANEPPTKDWAEAAVPLVPYKLMKKVNDAAQAARTGKEFRDSDDAKIVEVEHTGTAAMVQKFSRQNNPFKSIFLGIYRILTMVLGKLYYRPLRGDESEKIAGFSRGMGIRSTELLMKKGSADAHNEKVFGYYRGPKYLFGQSIHKYHTINDWFIRKLTDPGTEEYLESVVAKESKLTANYGEPDKSDDGTNISRLVIANSDSRVRQRVLIADEFGVPQELTGKVLSDEAAIQAGAWNDNPTFYKEKYKYTTKNAIGRENDDPIEINSADIKAIQKKIENNSEKIEKLKKNLDSLKTRSKLNPRNFLLMKKVEFQIKRLNSRNKKLSGQLVIGAQHELLGGMWRAFNRRGAIQIIQRLAPADVHNYVAPLNGKPLSHKEACEVLEKYLQKQQNLGDAAEIEHLKNLIQIFKAQKKELGRPSQSTIDIYGTNESVSTPAVANKSSILAQNDRKVMMFLHEDGSFSMHVFIGATGVNKVDVDPQTRAKMKQGVVKGNMQFGPDVYGKTADNMTRDSHRKLRLGEWKGGFPINGSTVLSYYFPNDFAILPKVRSYKEKAVYGKGAERSEVELKVNMGDPLLIKTEILYAQVLERFIPFKQTNKEIITLDSLFEQIRKMDLKSLKYPYNKPQYFEQDREILTNVQILFNKSPLTADEKELVDKIKKTLENRLERLKENTTTEKVLGVTPETLEAIRDCTSSAVEKQISEAQEPSNSALGDLLDRTELVQFFSSISIAEATKNLLQQNENS